MVPWTQDSSVLLYMDAIHKETMGTPASRQEDKSKDTLGMDVCCFQLHLKGRI